MIDSSRILRSISAAFLILPAGSSVAQACSVCMGAGNSDMARGFYWGILILMVLPMALLAAVTAGIYFASRKRKMHGA